MQHDDVRIFRTNCWNQRMIAALLTATCALAKGMSRLMSLSQGTEDREREREREEDRENVWAEKCSWRKKRLPGQGRVVAGACVALLATAAATGQAVRVTGVSPSSGPNSGNTTVAVKGEGFSTTSNPQITFGQVPARVIGCTPTTCTVDSPQYFVGQATNPQLVNVQVTVKGNNSTPTAESSFTYEPGPLCTATLSCKDVPPGFYPTLQLSQCSAPANFYEGTLSQTPASQNATSFTDDTDGVFGFQIAACTGQNPTLTNGWSGGSCSFYPAYTSPCGTVPPEPSNFCQECRKTGGICTTAPGGKKFCVHE